MKEESRKKQILNKQKLLTHLPNANGSKKFFYECKHKTVIFKKVI